MTTQDPTSFNASLSPERRKRTLLKLRDMQDAARREGMQEACSAIEDAILALTEPLDDHDELFGTEEWGCSCLCRECLSYGD